MNVAAVVNMEGEAPPWGPLSRKSAEPGGTRVGLNSPTLKPESPPLCHLAVNRSGVGKIELLGTGTRFKGAVNGLGSQGAKSRRLFSRVRLRLRRNGKAKQANGQTYSLRGEKQPNGG